MIRGSIRGKAKANVAGRSVPDICVMARVGAQSLDVHEESLPVACGTPLLNSHVSLGQRSDVLHLVIISLRLSRPVVSSHVYVASKILPW